MRVRLVVGVLALGMVLSLSPVHLMAKSNGQLLASIKSRAHQLIRGFKGSTVIDKALWQKLMFGAGVVVTCLGVSCSSTIERGTVQQGQLSQADIVGQHVHAIVDDQSHIGYVSQANSTDEVILTLYSGNELVIKVAEVSGTIYRVHEDLGKSVFLSSVVEDDALMVAMHGLVTSVYSDSYYQVMVGAWLDVFGDVNILNERLSVVVHVNDLEFIED